MPKTGIPFREIYLKDVKRWTFINELWMTYERAQLVKQFNNDHDTLILVDSGLLMSWVYTYSHFLVGNLNLNEWEFYEKLYNDFAEEYLKNSSVVLLKYSIDTLMQRLKKRGRDYELEFYTREYLEQIDEGLVALQKKLQQMGSQIILIDEKDLADFENNEKDTNSLISTVKNNLHNS